MKTKIMIKIRKATGNDLKEYVKLMKESNKEYSKIIGEKVNFSDKEIKEEFNSVLKSQKEFLLLAQDNEKIVGYLMGNFTSYKKKKTGNIDFLFVPKNHRKKGIASLLMKTFTKILKKKGIKKYKLKMNIKNKNAFNFYKNLGFKITNYNMEKNIR